MNKLLEELRAQRELIRKHLEWIEGQIATLENRLENGPENGKAEEKVQEIPESEHSEKLEDQEKAEKYLQDYKPATGNDIQRAKMGCLILFILCTGTFLFLLFGLPYLLD
jgi:hypothetical protein